MANARISIIIPTYNQEKYILEAINSACNQTYDNIEVIIVNDGSTDDTENLILESIKRNSNIVYIKQLNQGLSISRNNGISNASGDFIAFLDSDDFWAPNKIEILVEFMKRNPHIGLVHSPTQVVDENSNKTDQIYSGKDGYLFDDLLTFNGTNIPPPSSILIRKEVIDTVGMFNEDFEALNDQEFYIRVAEKFKIGKVNDILSYYRLHSENMHKNNVLIEYEFIKLLIKIRSYSLEKRIKRNSSGKVYFLVSIIRWKSKKRQYKSLYYILMSVSCNPKFLFQFLHKKIKQYYGLHW